MTFKLKTLFGPLQGILAWVKISYSMLQFYEIILETMLKKVSV